LRDEFPDILVFVSGFVLRISDLAEAAGVGSMEFVDLSATLENDGSWAPPWGRNHIRYESHRFGRFAMWWLFGVTKKYLKTGLGWAHEVLRISTHGTTHVDAPWHYGPQSGGKPARTIDEMPLSTFYGPGVVLDIRHVPAGEAATVADVKAALAGIDHQLRPGEIALVKTGNDRLLGRREYFFTGPGVSAEATRWLINQGVRLMGIDAWGWDAPLKEQARRARRENRDDLFWSAHYVGVDQEYCHMERLANLERLPPKGFTVCAFPLKIKRGSAGPARVVALLPD
jgi:kynurenine formamidase